MYFGSVRFFKNLILLVVIVLIAIPAALALWFGYASTTQGRTVSELTEENTSLSTQNSNLTAENATLAEKNELLARTSFFVSADPIDYQELYPDFYAEDTSTERTVSENTVYLTFDDGPSPRTPEVLQILADADVKATFFVVGKTDDQSNQWMRDIVEQGHTIGMHSFSHNYEKIYASVEAYLDDMDQLYHLIKDTTGVTPSVFRFPGGSINSYNGAVYQEIIAEMLRRGFVFYDWNVAASDATSKKLDSGDILTNVLGGAKNKSRCIVLMHDSKPMTVTRSALADVIRELRDMGFTFDKITPDVLPVTFSYIN